MKIGLLAYHAACNFGAFLQLLSTVEYLKKRGDEPRVINWVPEDFKNYYELKSVEQVRLLYSQLRERYYPLTPLCETDKDVASLILKEGIQAVIIGSDAVCQHHPFRERFHFPVRRIFYVAKFTSDRMYPNCFWASFNKYLKNPVPVAVISGSSQDSKYELIGKQTKAEMKRSIMGYRYISVRDEWTKKMIAHLTDNEVIPEVTPDPVFAFNSNAGHLVPTKEEILEKFQLPAKYLLVSFKGPKSVDQKWITSFEKIVTSHGIVCVKLPYADAPAFGEMKYAINADISPLDWYGLIKYSCGYVGNNMHPIVTSLANGVPFYSFDNYGHVRNNGKKTNGESSKIYHILSMSGFEECRSFVKAPDYIIPTPESVWEKIFEFDTEKEKLFAKEYLLQYNDMMEIVYKNIL